MTHVRDNNDNETKQNKTAPTAQSASKTAETWDREAVLAEGRSRVLMEPREREKDSAFEGQEEGCPHRHGARGSRKPREHPRRRAQLGPAMKLAHSKCELLLLLLLLLLNKKNVLWMTIIGLPLHEKGFPFFHMIILSDSSITMLMC